MRIKMRGRPTQNGLQPIDYDRQNDEKRCRVTHEMGLKGRFVGVEVAKADKGNGPPRNRHAITNLAPATLDQKSRDDYGWSRMETFRRPCRSQLAKVLRDGGCLISLSFTATSDNVAKIGRPC